MVRPTQAVTVAKRRARTRVSSLPLACFLLVVSHLCAAGNCSSGTESSHVDEVLSLYAAHTPGQADDIVRAVAGLLHKHDGSVDTLLAALRQRHEQPASTAGRKQTAAGVEDYAEQLSALYRAHAPHKLAKVASLLLKYKGAEDRLLSAVRTKYDGAPTNAGLPPVAKHAPGAALGGGSAMQGERAPQQARADPAGGTASASIGQSAAAGLRKVSKQFTQAFIKALLPPREGGADAMHAGCVRARDLWLQHSAKIGLRSMIADSTSHCARLFGATEDAGQCKEAYRSLITGLVSPGEIAEVAWELFTGMLPRLQDVGADLESDVVAFVSRGESSGAENGGLTMSPLMAALFTGHTKALSFLAAHGHCAAVRNDDGSAAWSHDRHLPSPLVRLIHLWGTAIPKGIRTALFSPEGDGRFRPLRGFAANVVEFAQGGAYLLQGADEDETEKIVFPMYIGLSLMSRPLSLPSCRTPRTPRTCSGLL